MRGCGVTELEGVSSNQLQFRCNSGALVDGENDPKTWISRKNTKKSDINTGVQLGKLQMRLQETAIAI